MDFQTRQAIAGLVEQLTDLQDKVARAERAAGTPQLPNSSITGGAITAVDEDGTHRGCIGFQGDGTFGTVAQNGPPPPAPSAPAVTPGQLSLSIAWDGLFAAGDDGDPATQPLDFDHVQVHLSDTAGFTPDATTLRGSLAKPGALVVTPLSDATTYYTVLVGVNTSGVAGDASGEVSGVPDAVVATDVIDGIITTVKLADDAVTEAKIAAAAVGTTEIADDAVTTPKVVAGAIQAAQIAAGAVSAGALAAGAVTTEKLDALAVTADKIAANAITAGKLDAGAVTAGTVAAGAIDGTTITGATVITDSGTGGVFVYDGAPASGNLIVSLASESGTDAYGNAYPQGMNVTKGEIDGTKLNAATITAGSLSAGSIGSSSITGSDFSNGTIEDATITFDSSGGTLLVYTSTTTTQTFTTAGDGTWTCPAGVTSVQVECWGGGGGGGGGGDFGGQEGGYGGGGGAYAKVRALAVTPGTGYSYHVGSAGVGGDVGVRWGGNGEPTSFASACFAESGRCPTPGAASACTGDIAFDGGAGGTSISTPGGGGGGGASAGSASIGNSGKDASGASGGAGGAGISGSSGSGGNGGNQNAPGAAGNFWGSGGGGGGGGTTPGAGGAGGPGRIKLTYVSGQKLIASISGVAGTDSYGNAYPAGIWAPTGVGNALYKKKTANQSITSSTTLVDDADLQVTVAANATYKMTAVLKYEAGTTGDFNTQWVGPSGSSVVGTVSALLTTAASDADNYTVGYALSEVHAAGGRGAGNARVMQFVGTLTTGGTAGTIKLQWAQFASDTVATILYAGSYLILERIA